MQILDEKLEKNWENYLLQSLAAGLSMLFILGLFTQLKYILDLFIVAAAGSTAFTVFSMPHYYTYQTRNIVGGHSICTVVGFACSHIPMVYIAGGGAAVGIGTLLMVSTKTEHPPAAGTALGLAVHFVGGGAIFILGCAVALSGIRILLLPWLKDLM